MIDLLRAVSKHRPALKQLRQRTEAEHKTKRDPPRIHTETPRWNDTAWLNEHVSTVAATAKLGSLEGDVRQEKTL